MELTGKVFFLWVLLLETSPNTVGLPKIPPDATLSTSSHRISKSLIHLHWSTEETTVALLGMKFSSLTFQQCAQEMAGLEDDHPSRTYCVGQF